MSIRLADPAADADALRAIYAPYVTETVISFEYAIPSVETMRERIAKTLEFHPWLVYEQEGAVIGYAYAGKHRERAAYQWSTDVSVYVSPQHHRKGIGRALYTELFALLRRQGFCNAFAGITLPNDASVGVHRAMGFEMIGMYQQVGYKFGRWHDTGWMQLRLQPADHAPTPLIPICELV
jgi:L-amino acid N-acyltransferase YncA